MNLNDDFDFDDNAFDESQGGDALPPDDSGGDYPEERRPRRRGAAIPNLSGLTRSPLLVATLAFILGLALGWFGIGWGVWPVEWTDAAAEDLRADLREEWLRMTIDSHTLRPDFAKLQNRYSSLGENAPSALATVEANPGAQGQEAILLLRQLQNQGGMVVGPPATNPATGAATGGTADSGGGSNTLLLFAVCFFATLLLGGVLLFLYFRSRRRSRAAAPQTAAQAASRYSQAAEKTDYTARGQAAPVAQWMTTYLIGDDLFDDSFSIDAAAGEFLGECGVGVADTIGVGEPKRVTAFEIWLFDKNDIQTVTKVIMSDHVYNDDASRERLSAKGEPVLARPGAEAVLETATLQLVARVVDMAYGEGALPANSFFDRLTMEIAVWPK